MYNGCLAAPVVGGPLSTAQVDLHNGLKAYRAPAPTTLTFGSPTGISSGLKALPNDVAVLADLVDPHEPSHRKPFTAQAFGAR